MERVIALREVKDNKVYSYGEGDMEELIPNESMFVEHGLKNPCIKLDTGKIVWGFQCWWGPVEKVKSRYYTKEYEVIPVDVDPEIEVAIYTEGS